MKLNLDKIKNKHKNFPCVVSLHGPSMETHRDVIQNLQVEKKVLRISTNEWWEYFKEKPDYLIIFSWHIYKTLINNIKKKGFSGKFIIPLPSPRVLN